MKKLEHYIELFIFNSRWLQLPIYLGLIVAAVMYGLKFMVQLWGLVSGFSGMTENTILLTVLGLIDISMVINLLVIVFIGGYTTFVSKIDFANSDDKPIWLDKINSGTLKIKLIISLVSISGVDLLKTFIDVSNLALQDVLVKVGIHIVFLLSVVVLAYSDKLMHAEHTEKKH